MHREGSELYYGVSRYEKHEASSPSHKVNAQEKIQVPAGLS